MAFLYNSVVHILQGRTYLYTQGSNWFSMFMASASESFSSECSASDSLWPASALRSRLGGVTLHWPPQDLEQIWSTRPWGTCGDRSKCVKYTDSKLLLKACLEWCNLLSCPVQDAGRQVKSTIFNLYTMVESIVVPRPLAPWYVSCWTLSRCQSHRCSNEL